MITNLDYIPWNPSDLTGNSALVSVGTTLFAAGMTRTDGKHYIYTSGDAGKTWAASITLPASVSEVMLATDPSGMIHMAMWVATSTPTLFNAVRLTYDTTTGHLSNPVVLVQKSSIVSGLDIVALEGGASLVVVAGMEPLGYVGKYVFLALEITAGGVVQTTPLFVQPWMVGDTCGGVSIVKPDTGNIEVYYSKHPRNFQFKDMPTYIATQTRTGAGVWGPATLLPGLNVTSRHTDDKLTVLAAGTERYVCNTFHTLKPRTTKLRSSVVYGVGKWVGSEREWTFGQVLATDAMKFREPTLVVTPSGVVLLAYIACPWTQTEYASSGKLVLNTLNQDMTLTVKTGAWSLQTYRWLRGTKQVVDVNSVWSLMGIPEASGGVYLSEFNLPPTAVVLPSALTVKRGVPSILDGSSSFDSDLDPLVFTWSHDCPQTAHVTLTPFLSGKAVSVLVAKAFGPEASSFNVTLTVKDPTHPPVSVVCPVTVPLNASPVVTLTSPVTITRNSVVRVQATITDSEDQDLEIHWVQTAGTPVAIAGASTAMPELACYRLEPGGETLKFWVTVQDHVNPPVVAELQLVVPAMSDLNVESGSICSTMYSVSTTPPTLWATPATMSQRHHPQGVWPMGMELPLNHDTTKFKLASCFAGARGCYLSPKSFLVKVLSPSTPDYFARRIAPSGESIVDAWHAPDDSSYVLTDAGKFHRYTTLGPGGISDWPDSTLDLRLHTSATLTNFTAGEVVGGNRIVAFWGNTGAVLLAVDDLTFTVNEVFHVTTTSRMLLGSDNITFLRLGGVSSLRSGQVLVGTKQADGSTTERLIDLGARRPVGSWEHGNKLSNVVNTGEILKLTGDSYLTKPVPPEWREPEMAPGGQRILSWTQQRPDIVMGYEVWQGVDNAPPVVFASTPSGSIRRVTVTPLAGHRYVYLVRALGVGGLSPFSSELTIGELPITPPV